MSITRRNRPLRKRITINGIKILIKGHKGLLPFKKVVHSNNNFSIKTGNEELVDKLRITSTKYGK